MLPKLDGQTCSRVGTGRTAGGLEGLLPSRTTGLPGPSSARDRLQRSCPGPYAVQFAISALDRGLFIILFIFFFFLLILERGEGGRRGEKESF